MTPGCARVTFPLPMRPACASCGARRRPRCTKSQRGSTTSSPADMNDTRDMKDLSAAQSVGNLHRVTDGIHGHFCVSQLQLMPEISDGTQSIEVIFEISNTGHRAGVEVAQVYLGLPAAASSPPKKLVGWARVRLEPGEQKSIAVTLNPQSSEHPLSYWNADTQRWEIANGDYTVHIGASSRDIRLTGHFHIRSLDGSTE